MMGNWDWTKIRDFLEALVIIWGFISGGIVLWLRGQFVTRKTYDAEVKRLDTAIAQCRSTSNAESNALNLALSALDGTLKGISERLRSGDHLMARLEVQYDRINEFLMSKSS